MAVIVAKPPSIVATRSPAISSYGPGNTAIRTEHWRYIRYEDGSEELYDHENDKWEWHNLADDPEYAEIKAQMRKGIPAHHEPTGALQGAFERKRKAR